MDQTPSMYQEMRQPLPHILHIFAYGYVLLGDKIIKWSLYRAKLTFLLRWLSGKDHLPMQSLEFDLWVGKFLGEGNDNPLQYACMENPMDRGAWQVTVNGITKTQTQLSIQFSSVAKSCLTLQPHGLQHTRPPCPSPTPSLYSNSCPLSW